MCGIIAVVRRRSERSVPESADLLALINGTTDELEVVALDDAVDPLTAVGERLHEADRLLRGTPGLRALLADSALVDAIGQEMRALNGVLDRLEAQLLSLIHI